MDRSCVKERGALVCSVNYSSISKTGKWLLGQSWIEWQDPVFWWGKDKTKNRLTRFSDEKNEVIENMFNSENLMIVYAIEYDNNYICQLELYSLDTAIFKSYNSPAWTLVTTVQHKLYTEDLFSSLPIRRRSFVSELKNSSGKKNCKK